MNGSHQDKREEWTMEIGVYSKGNHQYFMNRIITGFQGCWQSPQGLVKQPMKRDKTFGLGSGAGLSGAGLSDEGLSGVGFSDVGLSGVGLSDVGLSGAGLLGGC